MTNRIFTFSLFPSAQTGLFPISKLNSRGSNLWVVIAVAVTCYLAFLFWKNLFASSVSNENSPVRSLGHGRVVIGPVFDGIPVPVEELDAFSSWIHVPQAQEVIPRSPSSGRFRSISPGSCYS